MNKKKIALIISTIALSLLPLGANASQGGGGYSGTCGDGGYYRGAWSSWGASTCEMAGAGWAYYTYDNGWNTSMPFGPYNEATGGERWIGSDCPGYGGFYHYGYIDWKDTTWWYNDQYSVTMTGNASIGNTGRMSALTRGGGGTDWLAWNADYNPDPGYYEDYNLPGSGNQVFWSWNTQIAHLNYFESTPSVYEKYKVYLNATNATNIWNWYDGGISYFCYGPGMLSAKYSGSTTAQVNGNTVANNSDTEIRANSATVRFLHTITRQNEGASQAVSTQWNVTGSNWTHALAWVSLDKSGANSSKVVWMDNAETVNIAPGQKRTFDQTLGYYKEATLNGVKDGTWEPGSKYTVSVHRPISNTINGRTLGRVNGVDVANGGLVEITSGNSFTVSFAHQLSRGDDYANGTVDVPYKTNISARDSRNKHDFPYGTVHEGTYTGLAENSGWKNVITFANETISGTLLPDETKTFCQNMTYASVLNYDGGNTNQTTVTYCVSVHRPKSTCGGKDVSVLTSHNFGRIQARKTNTNGSTAWEDTALVDTGNSTVTIWARPDNKVHFKEEMCESAELANQYFDLRKGITYTIDATSNTYMENLSPSSWNNSSINSSAYEGHDIFGGTSYRKTTESPASSTQSTKYNITNEHLGNTFYQRLTWTDLWTNNGAAVRGHDGSRNATATANVYIPYNYRLNPETSSGNNPHVMPGTQTYTITPTITVEPRKNTPVNGDTTYATQTKQTKYQVVSYRIGSGKSASEVYTTNNGYYAARAGGDANLGAQSICTQFLAGGATNCRKEAEGTNIYNPGKTTLDTVNIDVDEVIPIGTKICTVVAVWPSDSHNMTDDVTNASQEANALYASENQGTRMWRVSQPTCSSVAKKPNFHSYNSGVYAEDEINTAVSNRTHRTSSGAERKRSYGSWSEFDVTSGNKETLGLSSGARLWGGITTQSDSNKYCYVSGLTFTNDKCNGSGDTRHVGKKNVNKLLASDPENIYNQIMTRYTKSDSEDRGIGDINTTTNLQIEGACEYDEISGRYTPKAINGSASPSFSCLSNGAYYTKVRGDAATATNERTVITGYDWRGRPIYTTYISEMWTSTDGEHSSNTYVTHVKGTLYINQNFHYGNIQDLQNTEYQSISQVPQTLFIAKDIKISSDVDHIDAWLIAENSIDTCYPSDGKPVSVDNCNSQLTVTGPVISKKLYLNRTYGGGRTTIISNNNFNDWITEDSQGAEIFKMNPFTYLWSYSQSQRYSQAITTYSRELPTRF